jgi:hypothetical protein
MIQIERPIGRADMEFYEGHAVEVAAIALHGKGEDAWNKASQRVRNHHRKKALDVIHAVFNDTGVVARLPVLTKNLLSRQ